MGLRTLVKRWIGGIVRGSGVADTEAIPRSVSMAWAAAGDARRLAVTSSRDTVELTVASAGVRISGN